MVNSSNPSKDRVTLRSCYSLHEASQKPNHRRNTLPPATFTNEIFQRPPFRLKSTPARAPPSDLPSGGSLVGKYLPKRHTLQSPVGAEIHAPERGGACDTILPRASSSRCFYRRQAHPSTPRAPSSPKKTLLFHFFSPATVFAFFCRLNLHCFCVL